MLRVLAVAGSPSATSNTAAVVERAGELLLGAGDTGVALETLRLREIPAAALIHGDTRDAALAASHRALAAADGVIVGTPVYKASFSGLLKCWLDSLDQFALRGKSVLPLAVGGGTAHVLVLDYALRPVLQSFDPRQVTAGYFIQEGNVTRGADARVSLPSEIDDALEQIVGAFRRSLPPVPPTAG